MRTASLRVRVVVGGVAVVAVVLMIVGASVHQVLRARVLTDLDGVLDARAALAEDLAGSLDPVVLVERLDGGGVHVAARLGDGTILRSAPTDPAVDAPGPDATGPTHRLERDVALPDGGALRLSARSMADDTLGLLAGPLVAAVALGTLAASGLLWLITTRALQPLDQVVETARRIQAGATSERLDPDRTTTELGRMAAAFDEMLDELAAALADARASEERSRRFLADAAHQLRTPVAGIGASAELLAGDVTGELTDEDRAQLLANLTREAARAGQRVHDLLRVLRLDRAEPTPRRTTDLVPLCRHEVERARSLAPSIAIGLDADAAGATATVDAAGVQEIVANLLDNARRHARRSIDVTVAADPEAVTVSVRDDGAGPSDPERSFDRFVSLDGHGGSGLGLSIARAIARSHGGDLTFEGGEFVLHLPAASDPAP